MEWLNYHHLYYFWVVAKEGSITKASKMLRLAHPTISGQVRRLEEVLGEKLLKRQGRNVVMTETGRVAFRYAEAIFPLGREFLDTLRGRARGAHIPLVVGVSDVIAKSLVHRILAPVFALETPVRVICKENRSIKAFLSDLAAHSVDVVLSDAPAPPGSPVKTFSHPLGECGSAFFASPRLAKRYRHNFPACLDGAPVLLPSADSTFRRALDDWFDARDLRPTIVAELDDAALAMTLGEAGLGVFAAPQVIAKDIAQRYRVHSIGLVREVRQRFYAISVERRLRHPAVVAICQAARRHMFAAPAAQDA
ncbi:MAG: transcriptional activator NhaR [Myxococcaceae bacterium]